MTRTSTGKLPLPRQLDIPDSSGRATGSRASSSEIKEKMEQQLRLQRDANNKKRAEEMKGGGKIQKILDNSKLKCFLFLSSTTIQDICEEDFSSKSRWDDKDDK